MRARGSRVRWIGLCMLATGMLLQAGTGTTCNDLAVNLASSISTQFIRNTVYDALNVSGTSSLGGLAGLTGT